jgi:hypothetical protein
LACTAIECVVTIATGYVIIPFAAVNTIVSPPAAEGIVS